MVPSLVDGLLPPGIHNVEIEEVIATFSSSSETRKSAGKALRELANSLKSAGALYLLVGGSYPTSKPELSDVDVIAVFRQSDRIPRPGVRATTWGVTVDVQYASEDEDKTLNAFVSMFRRGRDETERGLLLIALNDSPEKQQFAEPNDEFLTLVRRIYSDRSVQRTVRQRGLLVTIHGIMSHAPWNADFARLASSEGWVVAPFIHGYHTPLILLQRKKRRLIARNFSDWLHRIVTEEKLPVSVVAHSLGTYIALTYLQGYDEPPHPFRSLILTGAILNRNLDWDGSLKAKVYRVRHERTPSDPWVARMPLLNKLARDDLFGDAGVTGFARLAPHVEERTALLFGHDDMIRSDVITQRWLPFLNSNSG